MSKSCCMGVLKGFLTDDYDIISDCPKLNRDAWAEEHFILKYKWSIRRIYYKNEAECLSCKKCLPKQ